ncbi:DUF2179 domain-containing protein [candidate division KSB1 bacterium]|nr:DUF2179 domain-containing protein [candidate division KSB1 bacterium]
MDSPQIFEYIILPLLIFCARVLDQSIGTMRIILISRGAKFIAPLLGFFEVIIWLLAITQIMKNLNNFISYIAYGGGFAFGNYVGILLEQKLALGHQIIRIISENELEALPMLLRTEGYAVTTLKGRGSKGPVTIVFTVVNRKDVPHVLKLVREMEPKAFTTVEDVRNLYAGYLRSRLPFRVAKKK